MPRPKWDDKVLIGIEPFDKDHKHLVALLVEIFDEFISTKRNKNRLLEILDALTTYTTNHFLNEEIWMRNFSYPRMEEHVRDHRRFIQRLAEFKQKYQDGTGHLTLEIITFLKVWLLTHIAITDADLGVFYREDTSQSMVIGQ